MSVDLSARALDVVELMDDPAADEEALGRTYRRFGMVNAVVSRPGRLYRHDIRPRASEGGRLRVLDIGAGGGDLCRDLVRRLRRDGLEADITALDADERAIRWASAHDDGAGIRYRHAFSSDLVAEGDAYDVVLSNHVLHHLGSAELRSVLDDSRVLAGSRGLVSHHDIARSRLAYTAFAAGTWPFARNVLAGSFIRVDGLLSIRRSYTRSELAAAVPSGWEVRSHLPARLEVRWEAADGRS
ncbi:MULTISPECIES: methyltransferase domain-containing protein [Microbacterium]|uniref:methyltransferase domain-containing protein n=1 Tax=Microbacterium TaxID=33882 RepID=UPI0011EB31C5|nr:MULTISPECIES: methyltransferase domain-containing protein [Microbacterium]